MRGAIVNIEVNGTGWEPIFVETEKAVQIIKRSCERLKHYANYVEHMDFGGKSEEEIKNLVERISEGLADMLDDERLEMEPKTNDPSEGKEEEKKDLPHEILKLIFSEYPDGVSVGETLHILNEARKLLDDIQIV